MQVEINCVAVVEKTKSVLVKVIMSHPEKIAMTQDPLMVLPRQVNGEGRLLYLPHCRISLSCSMVSPKDKENAYDGQR